MIRKIAVFNHKGGVSKTTTTFHLAWSLARMGKKVLMIDADSQCNLTLFALGYKGYEDLYSTNSKNNIKDALQPAFKAEPRLIQPVDCIKIRRSENLFLLPGHLDFTEYEVSLGVSFQLSDALSTMKNLPGAFNYMAEKTAEKYGAEYVLIDMNPSLSAINQDILVSSDYFLVPASPDFFSFMAIKSLSRVLPSWEKWAKAARDTFKDAVYPLPEKTPKFIGYTINDFNLSGGEAQRSFREIMDKIGKEVEGVLAPALSSVGMMLPDQRYHAVKYKDYSSRYCLAEISNFNKLIAEANKSSLPVFELPTTNLESNQIKTLNWFKRLFKELTTKILKLTS